jgi:hypothetical protein
MCVLSFAALSLSPGVRLFYILGLQCGILCDTLTGGLRHSALSLLLSAPTSVLLIQNRCTTNIPYLSVCLAGYPPSRHAVFF